MKHLEDIGDDLFDFSNFGTKATGLPMIIWIRCLGKSSVPIIYVKNEYDRTPGIEPTFAMSIDDEPVITSGDTGEIKESDINKVKKWIMLNKKALIRHWNAETTTDEFMDEASKVDSVPEPRFNDEPKKRISLLLKEKEVELDKYFMLYERTLEKNLIAILNQINIQASVKSDPYSLPFNKEILIPISYIGFKKLNQSELFRGILKQLLNEDVKKIRCYFYIGDPDSLVPKPAKFIFYFRYRVDK